MESGDLNKDREVKDSLGVSPALAGAAVYEGLPRVMSPMLNRVPASLADIAASGKPIKAEAWTDLRKITEFSRKEVMAIQNFATESGVKIPIVAGTVKSLRDQGTGYFDEADSYADKIKRMGQKLIGSKDIKPPGTSHIGLATSSVPQAMHEIGHAAPIGKSHTARRIFQEIGGHMGEGMPGHVARGALAAQVLAPPDEDSSGIRKMLYRNAPALVGATYVPELVEELRASGRALSGSRRHGVGLLRALKELGPNFATYAGAAAAPVLATILAKKLVQALHQKKLEGEEKTSAVKAPGALRTPASTAWRIGGRTPPKPKSIKPNTHELGDAAKTRAPAKPPSNKDYHKDMLESLYNPGRGYRLAVTG